MPTRSQEKGLLRKTRLKTSLGYVKGSLRTVRSSDSLCTWSAPSQAAQHLCGVRQNGCQLCVPESSLMPAFDSYLHYNEAFVGKS